MIAYRQAILQAFGDVQTALNAVDGVEKQALAQAVELAQAQRALSLAESRYKAGADNLQTLLDVQRVAYQSRDLAVQIRQERLQASIALYRALGGGWRRTPEGQRVEECQRDATVEGCRAASNRRQNWGAAGPAELCSTCAQQRRDLSSAIPSGNPIQCGNRHAGGGPAEQAGVVHHNGRQGRESGYLLQS